MSRSVVKALTDDELDASLAHERAHHQTRDNLKRLLVACSPDLLGFWPGGREIERRWREAVEFAADARAASGSEGRGLLLASALLKVARMTPATGVQAAGSGFYDGAPIWERISRLLAPRRRRGAGSAARPRLVGLAVRHDARRRRHRRPRARGSASTWPPKAWSGCLP